MKWLEFFGTFKWHSNDIFDLAPYIIYLKNGKVWGDRLQVLEHKLSTRKQSWQEGFCISKVWVQPWRACDKHISLAYENNFVALTYALEENNHLYSFISIYAPQGQLLNRFRMMKDEERKSNKFWMLRND